MRPLHEVAELLSTEWRWIFGNRNFSAHQKRMLAALRDCRTIALGGHMDACLDCGTLRISYNSCRNRHCPKCQNTQREKWVMAREAELLPVPYFHVVFTIPDCLNEYCELYPKTIYDILFKASWQTLQEFAKDKKHLGANSAATMVLHTWGQNLMPHPHVHCIVPGGGLTSNGKWKAARNKGKYLFPVKAMSLVFRAKFISLLRSSPIYVKDSCYKQCFKKPWVVYAKRPFIGPQQVVEYLGRYSHKIAISNHRIKAIKDDKVLFKYKDYRDSTKSKTMSLSTREFIRRFAMHILPPRYVRIRHFGFLASRHKKAKLELIRKELGVEKPSSSTYDWKMIAKEKLSFDPDICQHCGGIMTFFKGLPPARAPPIVSSCTPDLV